MRWTKTTAWSVSLCAAALATAAISCTQQVGDQPQAVTDDVHRGKYVVTISGCNDCHTPGGMYGAPDSTRLLSGSELGWQGPWGVTYARNLTPDPETGIGSWTEVDIEKALRQGQRPDGTPVLPPMPWPDLAHLNAADMRAVIAYLKSIPPVKHVVPARVPPGQPVQGSIILSLPMPPPAWDGQNLPAPSTAGAPADTGGGR